MLLVGVDARHVSSEERLNGFAEYFRKRGTDVSHVIYGKGSHELTYRQTRDMIAVREHISASSSAAPVSAARRTPSMTPD